MDKAKSLSFVLAFLTLCFLFGCESTDSSALSISPNTADFEKVEVDDNKDLELTITNNTEETLTLQEIYLEEEVEFHIEGGDNTPIDLESNEKHTVIVTFKSTTAGNFSDKLVIKNSASTTPKTVNIVSTCTPSTALNILKTSPSSLDFGSVNIGDMSKMDLILTNKYNKDIAVVACMLTGSNDFVITAGAQVPFLMRKNESHPITVMFTPTSTGVLNANLNIVHNASPKHIDVNITGTGVAVPRIKFSETKYNFGNKAINSSTSFDIDIMNIGNSILVISALDIIGPGASAFSITNGMSPISIQPGTKHTVTISFHPTALGVYEAYLRVIHNGVNVPTPYEINLKGRGAAAGPNIEISCNNQLNFGSVSMSNPSILTVEIENIGLDPMTLSSIDLMMNTVFKIDSIKDSNGQVINLPKIVNPGDKVFVAIKFTPTGVANFNDTLTIIHDAINKPTPYDINVTGTGTN